MAKIKLPFEIEKPSVNEWAVTSENVGHNGKSLAEALGEGGGCKVVNIAEYAFPGGAMPVDADEYVYKEGDLNLNVHSRTSITGNGHGEPTYGLVFCVLHMGDKGYYYVYFMFDNGCWRYVDTYIDDIPDWVREVFNEDLREKVEDVEQEVGNLENLQTEAKDNLVNAINEAATKGGNCKVVNIIEYCPAGVHFGEHLPFDADVYIAKGELNYLCHHRIASPGDQEALRFLFCVMHEGGESNGYVSFILNDTLGFAEFEAIYPPQEDVPEWILKAFNEDLSDKIGDLSALQTTAKGNLVEAINEAAASGGGGKVVNVMDYLSGGSKYGELMPVDADVYVAKSGDINMFTHQTLVLHNEMTHLLFCMLHNEGGQGKMYADFAIRGDWELRGEYTEGMTTIPDWIRQAFSEDLRPKVEQNTTDIAELGQEVGKVEKSAEELKKENAELKEDLAELEAVALVDCEMKYGQPRVLYGAGTPQEAIVPGNWVGMDKGGCYWNGQPLFVGQVYININATSNGRYTGVRNANYGDIVWKNF